MSQIQKLPSLYAYIYKILLKDSGKVVPIRNIKTRLNMVIRRAPYIVYYEILRELCEYKVLKEIGKKEGYLIIQNHIYNKQIERLKDYVFPFNPSIN